MKSNYWLVSGSSHLSENVVVAGKRIKYRNVTTLSKWITNKCEKKKSLTKSESGGWINGKDLRVEEKEEEEGEFQWQMGAEVAAGHAGQGTPCPSILPCGGRWVEPTGNQEENLCGVPL